MSSGLDARPTARMYEVEELVTMAWQGQIRVPHFQRDFRWRREDVRRLFDSVIKGYPVGSLLLWRRAAPRETLHLGALQISAPQMDRALWVVDGQQRITSLANALAKIGQEDARFALAYDLENERFVSRQASDGPAVVPLPIIFDLREILKWFASYPEISEHLDHATAITKSIRQFQVPAYEVEQEDIRVLQDIFDRMNNYGKRLRRSEVFSALNAGDEARRSETLTFDLIAAHLDSDRGFGIIDNDTVLKAVLARRGPDVMREIRTEFSDRDSTTRSVARLGGSDFPGESRDEAYHAGEDALLRAVAFLQDEAGVPHFTMLPYRYLLVVLARLFAHHPEPDTRSLQLLRRWYWRAAVTGPEFFKGSTTGAIRTLCNKVRPDSLTQTVQDLLDAVDRPNPPLPDLRRFRSNEASTKMALCCWWAARPRNLHNGAVISREDLSECLADRPTVADAIHYILPRQSIPEPYRLWAANRVLMPAPDLDVTAVADLVVQQPLDLDDAMWAAALRSHGITPELADLLAAGAETAFLGAREEVLHADLKVFLQRMCEWGFEDTPPLKDLLVEDYFASDGEEGIDVAS
jgi:hypothetical protein